MEANKIMYVQSSKARSCTLRKQHQPIANGNMSWRHSKATTGKFCPICIFRNSLRQVVDKVKQLSILILWSLHYLRSPAQLSYFCRIIILRFPLEYREKRSANAREAICISSRILLFVLEYLLWVNTWILTLLTILH